ncbi:Ribosomal protein S18 acetylase RimI [Paenibacillus sp. 1_12]|uniref:GNAT family N-acetyltransferase n=1 Tax=Paenibacillus sp. 1_12 TaxID=1566278 RepID=UPI0008F33DD4|nr:GNAT family N-acetyltransferase [Paenibacillus sp. 1_12]SFL34661.1 Ribosomal protein S18 acetylase RimI [Paenibacillus sp. 1_12]
MNDTIHQLEIRRANQDDIPKLQSLYIEAAAWMEAKGIDQWKTSDFTTEYMNELFEQSEVYRVSLRDEIVGGLSIQWCDPFIWKELDCDEAGYLHKLVVKREFGGMGLGIELLKWCEAHLKNNHKKLLRLDCMPRNEGLNAFYTTAGFEFRGRTDGKGWSANLYEKAIL